MGKSGDDYRFLDFHAFEEVEAEMDRIEAAEHAGTLTSHGNWSAGQMAWHCTLFMRETRDGFSVQPGWPVRFLVKMGMGKALKKWALGPKPTPRGMKLPDELEYMTPSEPIETEVGFGMLREEIALVRDGARYTQPSPIMGRLTHAEWVRLHSKHVGHHFGFLDLG